MSRPLRCAVIATWEDGAETVYGPYTSATADRRVEEASEAFPELHFRAVVLLPQTELEAIIDGAPARTSPPLEPVISALRATAT